MSVEASRDVIVEAWDGVGDILCEYARGMVRLAGSKFNQGTNENP